MNLLNQKLKDLIKEFGFTEVKKTMDFFSAYQLEKSLQHTDEVKLKKYSIASSITPEDILEIATQYKCSTGFVQLQYEVLINYCESKGKTYKNYKAALRNFVLRDMKQTIERRTEKNARPAVDARGLSK
jgi:hypothetical protein